MKTLIQKPIIHLNSEELPNEMRVDVLGRDYDEEPYDEIYDGNSAHLNDPIKIDNLISILNTLKGKGCNYVSIDFHTDHQELEFDGMFVGLATQEEIDLHKQKDKEYQIRMIKNKITEYGGNLKQFENKLKELTGE